MRYFAYVSQGKIAQLYDQMSELSNATETYQIDGSKERSGSASAGFKGILGGDIKGDSSRGFSAALTGQKSAIQKLRPLVEYIERNEEVANLNDLCKQGHGARLSAFAYTYRGTFLALGEVPRHPHNEGQVSSIGAGREIRVNDLFKNTEIAVSKEHLIDPARRENGHSDLTRVNGGGEIVSNIAVLLSNCQDYTISLACSYKYFSDMGSHWNEESRELDIHPHSGNYGFFRGEVSATFECLLFVNGVQSKTIFGSPLFLAYSTDSGLRL